MQEKNHPGAVVQVPEQPTSTTGGRHRQGRQKNRGDILDPALQIISDPDADPTVKLVGYLPYGTGTVSLYKVQKDFLNKLRINVR